MNLGNVFLTEEQHIFTEIDVCIAEVKMSLLKYILLSVQTQKAFNCWFSVGMEAQYVLAQRNRPSVGAELLHKFVHKMLLFQVGQCLAEYQELQL